MISELQWQKKKKKKKEKKKLVLIECLEAEGEKHFVLLS